MRLTGDVPLIVILGGTAIGKTGLAIELAQRANGEIISADSRQVYRHMDIGTAKPTPDQQAAVRHYMIDVVEPDETLSLAQFQRQAYALIDDIRQRGKLPLLVGGTGLYLTAVVEGWTIPEVPPNEHLRAELEAEAEAHGVGVLFERLRQVDPVAAEQVDGRNLRRVVRALEIALVTGEPLDYRQRKQPPSFPILQFGLTMERAQLYSRAEQRLDQMMAVGFLDEVRRLLEMGYGRDLPAMSGIGYRQLAAHLLDDVPLPEAVEQTAKATRNFIRRQYMWFRGHDSGIEWLDVTQFDVPTWADTIAGQVER
jgi:tRNA dimethylallyltransferase